MNQTFHYDYGELLIGMVGLAVGIVLLMHNRKKFVSYREAFYFIFSGLALILFSFICNGFVANRWDMNFAIAFLLLKKTGGWFCRGFAFFGYIFFAFGITVLFILLQGKTRKI